MRTEPGKNRFGRWTGSLVPALFAVMLGIADTAHAQWRQVNQDGFGAVGASSTWVMEPFRGMLYAGTGLPGHLYRSDGSTDARTGLLRWDEVVLPAELPSVGTVEPQEIIAAAVLPAAGGDWLYLVVNATPSGGSGRWSGLVKTRDGLTWTWTGHPLNSGNEYTALEVFNGRLYAAVGNPNVRIHPEAFGLYRTDGADWEWLPTDVTFGPNDVTFSAMQTFREHLYGSTGGQNETGDRTAQVWRSADGEHWTRVAELSSPTLAETRTMEVFHGWLYVGTKNHPLTPEEGVGPELWRSRDGLSWEQVLTEGQFPANALHVDKLQAHDGRLYAGLGGDGAGARVFASSDGTTWVELTPPGLAADRANYLVGSFGESWGRLFVGTGMNRSSGTEVWEYHPIALLRPDIRRPPERVIPLPPRLFPPPELDLPPPPPERDSRVAPRTPLAQLPGLAPGHARRLEAAGIGSIQDLAAARPEAVARIMGVPPLAARALVNRARQHTERGLPHPLRPQATPRRVGPPPG